MYQIQCIEVIRIDELEPEQQPYLINEPGEYQFPAQQEEAVTLSVEVSQLADSAA